MPGQLNAVYGPPPMKRDALEEVARRKQTPFSKAHQKHTSENEVVFNIPEKAS